MTSPLVVGPVQGYRCWRVEREGDQPVLRSLYYATAWPAQGPLQATCEAASGRLAAWARHILALGKGRHAAPTWGCQCGIYGVAGPEHTDTLALSPRSLPGLWVESWQVVGTVLLWGRVVQHEHGYRAEYARPLKLLAVPGLLRGRKVRALIEAVAHRYAIELVSDVGALTRR